MGSVIASLAFGALVLAAWCVAVYWIVKFCMWIRGGKSK